MAKTSGKKLPKQEKTKPSMRDMASSPKRTSGKVRIRQAARKASSPFGRVRTFGAKEYHPLKLPDNKAGRVLNKRVRIFPKFFREAWAEVRQTTWPNRRETTRLSFAVFVFAAVFSVIVAGLDLGLDKIFREYIIKV